MLRSCSQITFAAKLPAKLFDEEMTIIHNVSGHEKPKLDSEIITFIKAQSFKFLMQACLGHMPAHAWFLKIILRGHLYVCVSNPQAINNSGMM